MAINPFAISSIGHSRSHKVQLPSIGSFRLNEFHEDANAVTASVLACHSGNSITECISHRNEMRHMSLTEIRVEDYYLIRTGKLSSRLLNGLSKALSSNCFNGALLKTSRIDCPLIYLPAQNQADRIRNKLLADISEVKNRKIEQIKGELTLKTNSVLDANVFYRFPKNHLGNTLANLTETNSLKATQQRNLEKIQRMPPGVTYEQRMQIQYPNIQQTTLNPTNQQHFGKQNSAQPQFAQGIQQQAYQHIQVNAQMQIQDGRNFQQKQQQFYQQQQLGNVSQQVQPLQLQPQQKQPPTQYQLEALNTIIRNNESDLMARKLQLAQKDRKKILTYSKVDTFLDLTDFVHEKKEVVRLFVVDLEKPPKKPRSVVPPVASVPKPVLRLIDLSYEVDILWDESPVTEMFETAFGRVTLNCQSTTTEIHAAIWRSLQQKNSVRQDALLTVDVVRGTDNSQQFEVECTVQQRKLNLPRGYKHIPSQFEGFNVPQLRISNQFGWIEWRSADIKGVDFSRGFHLRRNGFEIEIKQLVSNFVVTFYHLPDFLSKKEDTQAELRRTVARKKGCRLVWCDLEKEQFSVEYTKPDGQYVA